MDENKTTAERPVSRRPWYKTVTVTQSAHDVEPKPCGDQPGEENTTPEWRVVATNIQTGEQRILSGCHSEDEAEAIVRMAVMRRGVNEEFFKAEPDTPPAEPNEPPTLTYGDEDKTTTGAKSGQPLQLKSRQDFWRIRMPQNETTIPLPQKFRLLAAWSVPSVAATPRSVACRIWRLRCMRALPARVRGVQR